MGIRFMGVFVLYIGLGITDARAQYEGNIWYFGWGGAGIDFNSGVPVSLADGRLGTDEGCATICDKQGALLFYTNGMTIYNRNHGFMPNGYHLMGHYSSTQSGIIVPFPDSPALYYVFTVTEHGKSHGLRYSVVDMRIDSGRGDVVAGKKNILLMTPTSERIAAIRHKDRKTYWVATRGINDNTFYAWHITQTGVSSSAVTSSVGSVHDGEEDGMVGYLKFSPTGKKAAYANRDKTSGLVELFDFDNATGKFSNPVTLPLVAAYGLEFAPNEKYLYATQLEYNSLVQYDISLKDESLIRNSRKSVQVGNTKPAALQLGPDAKIYVTQPEAKYLHAINFPGEEASNCNYQKAAVHLIRGSGELGLPCLMSDIFTPPDMNFRYTCHNDLTEIYMGTGTKIHMDFGDQTDTTFTNFSGTKVYHRYKEPGTYTVTLAYEKAGVVDTLMGQVVITPLPVIKIDGIRVICPGEVVRLQPIVKNADRWHWQNGDTSRILTLTDSGTYTFHAYKGGCHVSATVRVDAHAKLNLDLGADTNICPGKSIVIRAGDDAEAEYLWNNGSRRNAINVRDSGFYSVIKKDSCQILSDTIHLGFADCNCPVFIPNIFSPNNDRRNDTWRPVMCEAPSYDMMIFNRFGELIFHSQTQDYIWDGTFKGDMVQEGAYRYLLKARTIYDTDVYRDGWVTVIR